MMDNPIAYSDPPANRIFIPQGVFVYHALWKKMNIIALRVMLKLWLGYVQQDI